MPEIRLRDYTAKIKDLVRDGRHDEAIAHSKHILMQYPKHVETYGLLGEACLEKGLFREAIEFFQRTLSADPESFIARVGLGIICDEQSALPEAIWHMERAFELSPGNRVVRKELQRLYAQRDGVEKARLKLNRAALGRLYARNGLYERAIGEYRAVLREDPDLPGVRVALVEALWHEGRRLESVESCLDLLNGLPNCLKANLILGEIWLRSGNEEAGEERLKLVRALDPENRVAQEMMGRESPLPAEEVYLPELTITREVLAEALAGVGQTGAPVDSPVPAEQPPEEGEAVPEVVDEWAPDEETMDWLEETGLIEGEEHEPEEEPAPIEGAVPDAEVPDWLQGLVGDDLPEGEDSEADEVDKVDDIPEAEVPDWLQEMAPSEPEPRPADETGEEDEAGWVKNAAAGAAVAGAAIVGAGMLADDEEPEGEMPAEETVAEEAEEEVPDSLQALIDAGILDEADLEEAMAGMTAEDLDAQRAEEVPDWLQELTGVEGAGAAAVEEAPVEEAEAAAEVGAVGEAAEELGGEPVEVEEEPAEGVPDWLKELGAPAAAVGAGLAVAGALKGDEETAEEEAPVRGPAGEMPAEEAVAEETEEEVPDSLQAL
ncbi:MAG: tetratricopeptide repeat protein, partial [Anaerolineae bacterium]